MNEDLDFNKFNELKQENDNINDIIFPNCIEVLNKENKLILLIGSESKIFLYDIVNQKFLCKIKFMNLKTISDILVLTDKNILICDNKNKFILIDIKIIFNKIKVKLISEFKGKENSSSIFSLRELHNGLIISGDCNNLIFWEKNYLNRNTNILSYRKEDKNINIDNIIQIDNYINNNNLSFLGKFKGTCYNCLENC